MYLKDKHLPASSSFRASLLLASSLSLVVMSGAAQASTITATAILPVQASFMAQNAAAGESSHLKTGSGESPVHVINAGEVFAPHDENLDNTVIQNNGTLDLSEKSENTDKVIGSLGGKGNVNIGDNNLIITDGQNIFFDSDENQNRIQGVIYGNGGLTVVKGLTYFSGAEVPQEYKGETIIKEGATLTVGQGSPGNTLSNSSGIQLDGTLDVQMVHWDGHGLLASIDPVTHECQDTFFFAQDTVIKTLSGSSTGDLKLGNHGKLVLTNASGVYNGTITGDPYDESVTESFMDGEGAFIGDDKVGGVTIESGHEILGNANTYTGVTTVDNGATLALSGKGSVSHTSYLENDGTFDVSKADGNTSVNSLSGSGQINLGGHDLVLADAHGTVVASSETQDPSVHIPAGDMAFTGNIHGSGGLTVAKGSETLKDINDYTGQTTIDNGATLALAGDGSIKTSSSVNVDGTFDISGVTGVIDISSITTDVPENVKGTEVENLTGSGTVQLGDNTLAIARQPENYDGGRFDGNITGNGGFVIGSGITETLGGKNDYTGQTTIDNGATLALAGDGSISQSSNVRVDGTFDISGVNGAGTTINSMSGTAAVQLGDKTLTLANAGGEFKGVISGEGGGLTIASGTETLSGANSYTGQTTIGSGAELALSGVGFVSQSSGIHNDGKFNLLGLTQEGTTIQALDGSGTVELGKHILEINNGKTGNNVFSGSITGEGGNLYISGGEEIFTGNNSFTGQALIGENGSLSLNDGGTLNGVGSIADQGNLTLNNGHIIMTTAPSGTAGDNKGLFYIEGSDGKTAHLNVTNGSTIEASNAAMKFGDMAGSSGAGLIDNSKVDIGSLYVGYNGQGDLTISNGSKVAVHSDFGVGVVGNALSTVNVTGAGTELVSNGNGYWSLAMDGKSELNVSDGATFAIDKPEGAAFVDIENGSHININDGSSMIYHGDVNNEGQQLSIAPSGGASINVNKGGTLDISGTMATDAAHANNAAITMNGGTIKNSEDFKTNVGIDLASGTENTFDVEKNSSFTGQINGAGALDKTGSGTMSLASQNGYTGATTINGGSLNLVGDGSISTSSSVNVSNGASFDITQASGAETINSLKGDAGSTVQLGSNNLTLANADGAFTGNIHGSGDVTVAKGNETLAGINDYTGQTTIDNGATLALSGSGAIASSSGVQADGTFDISKEDGGNVGITSLSGAETGSVQLGSNNLTLTHGGDEFDGVVSGSGSVTVTGGHEIFGGANDYTGATNINASANLEINGDQSKATGVTTVNTLATLSGAGTVGGDVVVASGATLSPGADGGNSTGSLHINGNLVLQDGSTQNFLFGQPGVVGGSKNDWVDVAGNLTLGGIINVNEALDDTSQPGNKIYRLYDYKGKLSGHAKIQGVGNIGADTGVAVTLQTSVAHQVNAAVDDRDINYFSPENTPKSERAGMPALEGSLPVNEWSASVNGTGLASWTDVTGADRGSWNRGNDAIFKQDASIVAVNDTREGKFAPVRIGNMKFINDVGTYVITGDDLYSTGFQTDVEVGADSKKGAPIVAQLDTAINDRLGDIDSAFKAGASDTDVVKSGTGTLLVTADQKYHGQTVVTEGNLEVDADLTSSSLVSVGESSLKLMRDDSTTQPSAPKVAILSGNGDVNSVTVGDGGIVMAGTSSDPGGKLTVHGNLTMSEGSTVGVNVLSGAAEIPAVTPPMTGFLKSDSAQGAQSNSTNNMLYVTGAANLTDANVNVNFRKGIQLAYGQSYVFLQANKGITGIAKDGEDPRKTTAHLVTSIDNKYAFLDPKLGKSSIETASASEKATDTSTLLKDADASSSAEEAYVYLGRSEKAFGSVTSLTRNQREVAHALDRLEKSVTPVSGAVIGNPVLDAAYQITKGAERRSYDSFSGEIHASARTALIQDSFYIREAALNRLAMADCDVTGTNGISTADAKTGKRNDGKCESNSLVLWGEAYGSEGSNSGDGNASSMHHSSTGFIMGADAPVFDTWRVGGLISYGRSMFNTKGTQANGYSNNATVGAYAGTHWNNLYLRMGVAYSWNMMNMHHTATYGGERRNSDSNYRAGTAQAFAELGYRFHISHAATIEPFMNVAYVNLDTDKFKENRGLGLRGKNSDTGVTFSTFGVHMMTSFKAGQHMLVKPYATVAYRHAFGELTPTVHELFRNGQQGGTMDIGGVPLSKDSAVVDAGFSLNITDSLDIKLSYIGQYGNQSVDSGGMGRLSMKF